jgi:peptide/nickel transport system permease protein
MARDFLANGRPLYCRIGQEGFYPGLRLIWTDPQKVYGHAVLDSIQRYNLWRTFPYEAAVFAPIPFFAAETASRPPLRLAKPGTVNPYLGAAAHALDASNPPSNLVFRHWLGTDGTGHDVAAGLVYGARIAVLTGALAMSMALLIGLFLGSIAGFWGDDRLKIRRGTLLFTLLAIPLAWFYGFVARTNLYGADANIRYLVEGMLIFVGIIVAMNGLGQLLSRHSFFSKTVVLPADLLIMRAAEVLNSIPRLVFVIAIAVLLPQNQSIWLMIGLIGALGWTGFARYVRAELLRIRELDYITVARGMGFSQFRVLRHHALPNALRAVAIAFALGMANAILLESSLTFLGFGGNAFTNKSWGSLLHQAQGDRTAWWIALPPGLLICLTVWALHLAGEKINNKK